MSQRIKTVYNFEDYLISHIRRKYEEYQNINQPAPRSVYQRVELSAEQKHAVDEFYLKHYGKKVPYNWHRYFYAFSGKFDEKYLPGSLMIPELEWLLNPIEYTRAFEDKNITPLLANGLEGLATPDAIVSCAEGIYRDSDVRPITSERVKDILGNCGSAFLKPTVDTGSSYMCEIVEMVNGVDELSGRTVDEILKLYGRNFAAQRLIRTHESIQKIYAGAVSTFRVMTYRLPDGCFSHAPTVMRIGQGGSFVDNTSVGGMFVGIDDEGYLNERAYTYYEPHQVYFQHPDTNVTFKGYQIPLVKQVHEKALQMHARIPQVGIAHWDFTISEQGIPVLIEVNLRYGTFDFQQMAWGKGLFEENTAEILEFMREKRKQYPFKYK